MRKVGEMVRSAVRIIGKWNAGAVSVTLILMIVLGILTIYLENQKNSLADQLQASRWDSEGESAQLTYFFSERLAIDPLVIQGVRYRLDDALKAESIESTNSLARLYVDSYASFDTFTVKSERKSMEVTAIGVGGDFFMFHPLTLLNGQYFAESDIRKDVVLVDEDTAWHLFGSPDIVGQDIVINDVYYKVIGVFERERGELETMAGNGSATIYLPYESYVSAAGDAYVTVYEIVAPNPVKGFAGEMVGELFNYEESDMVVVENSSRFGYEAFYKLLKERAVRSMRTNDVIFPFWENLARVKEEKLAEVALVQVCIFTVVVIYWLGALIYFMVKHKPTKEGIGAAGERLSALWKRLFRNKKK